ncbi:hypothetical protein CISIN_1g047124mg [Citrus sinensis]|uniref:Uncharacterized protein n=1 Tax=Citrus sinensis TaxID=2711 RepID=A0A067EII7_CITSI|nr:hypothetical protein CISIN_1g047124mg [Citrus sinensis]
MMWIFDYLNSKETAEENKRSRILYSIRLAEGLRQRTTSQGRGHVNFIHFTTSQRRRQSGKIFLVKTESERELAKTLALRIRDGLPCKKKNRFNYSAQTEQPSALHIMINFRNHVAEKWLLKGEKELALWAVSISSYPC